ncbi:MAG: hypothetical protein R3F43_04260 [bacterium]
MTSPCAALANRSSGYDIDELRVSYDRELDIHVGIRAFGVAGDVDGDGRGETSPELRALGGIDAPDFGPPESVRLHGSTSMRMGSSTSSRACPFLGAIDPNDLERNGPRPGDANGFQVAGSWAG